VLISGGNNNPINIIIRKYNYGDSVAKLINLCDNEQFKILVKYDKSGLHNIELNKSESTYFVWPYPIDAQDYLEWTVDNNENDFKTLDLKNSSQATFKFNIQNNTQKEVTVVSYMNNIQRIILFTTNHSLADLERKKEAASMEVFVQFKGIEVSVINNVNLELATITISSSKPIWALDLTNNNEQQKQKHYLFTSEYNSWLDSKYLNYLLNDSNQIKLSNNEKNLELNFNTMQMQKPRQGRLKRLIQPGLSCSYKTSTSMMSVKFSIYRLQIDNQLPDAYFPVCFYKQPGLLTSDNKEPFLTLDLFTEQQEITQIYRYFKFNQQEFYLKVDKGFLYSLWDWYDAAITSTSTIADKLFDKTQPITTITSTCFNANILVVTDQEETLNDLMQLDKKLIKEIMEYQNQTGSLKQSSHIRFDDFCLCDLICNLSFSVNGKAHTDDKEVKLKGADSILNFFLESIGSTITEFKDVKFQFHSFKIKNGTLTWSELYDDLFTHYKIQALHQTYALLLGLDVLGNPFGLVTNVSQGLTDLFYDPLTNPFKNKQNNNNKDHDDDLISDDEYFELKMGSKLKDTIYKSISSLASSGSLITGSVGRVLATCTFDKEYKKRRQYKLSKSGNWKLADTLKIAAKGIALGTMDGLTGIVRKPMSEG